MSRRLSLSRQYLLLQVGIVLIVVVGVAAATLAQNELSFRRSEGRRMLSVAETVATTAVVRTGLDFPVNVDALAAASERARTTSGASYVLVTDPSGKVLWSPYPNETGRPLAGPLQPRAWVGTARHGDARAVEARVPIQAAPSLNPRDPGATAPSDSTPGEVLGYVAVGSTYPSLAGRLAESAPSILIYVGVAGLVGVLGSVFLARRVKRQTLGLEPEDIARLVEHRDAMLHGLREGVVGVDASGTVTLVNDEAVRLLGIPAQAVGRPVSSLNLDPSVLSASDSGSERVLAVNGRVLVLNRMPVTIRGRAAGWVTTLRDRTELAGLQRELDVSRGVTDALRSQAHEFSNRMHTIAGLIELEEYDELKRFVEHESAMLQSTVSSVSAAVDDPAVAALLIGKASRANELGVTFELDPESRLPRVSPEVAVDIVTVVGNLVDNAMEAVSGIAGSVRVLLVGDSSTVLVRVRDNGPGVDPSVTNRVFDKGVSTKQAGDPRSHGWGLALTRLVCERRGGSVTVRNEDGAVFEARLPVEPPSSDVSGRTRERHATSEKEGMR